jgi:hypothetical protein
MKKTSLSLLLALLAASAQADVRLVHVFGEHMVLQRDRPLTLWGQATPGQTLSVALGGRAATDTGAQEVASPQNPQLRQLRVPLRASLVGGDGLPMPPLRTDDWPLESAGRRYGH